MITKVLKSSASIVTKSTHHNHRWLNSIAYRFSLHNYMKSYPSSQLTIHHGRTRVDQNCTTFQDPAKLQQFIQSQQKLYDKQSVKWENRLQKYVEQVNSRRDQRTQSTTQIYNGYQYYTTVSWYQGRQYTQVWRKSLNSTHKSPKPQLVLDIMKYPLIKKHYQSIQLTRTVFSPCSTYIAFGFDLHNNQQISFMIKNIPKDHIVGVKNWENNRIKGVDNLVFNSNAGIFYTKVINYRPAELWYQDLRSGDAYIIYAQKQGQYYLDISMAKDGTHLIVNSTSKQHSKTWTINTSSQHNKQKQSLFTLKQLKRPQHNQKQKHKSKTYLNHNGKHFIIWRDSPQHNEICLLDQNTNKQTLLLKQNEAQTITDIDIFQKHIVLYIRKIVSPVVRIIKLDDSGTNVEKIYDLQMPYQFGSVNPGANQMLKSDTFLFYMNNLFVYNQGYEYNFATGTTTLKQPFKMTGPKFNPKDYNVSLHQVPTQDNQSVPLTIIVPKKYKNKRNKMLLHCYGHYGLAYQIAFNNTYWAALQNGWSLAYAHVRGGGEKGTNWHIQAVKENKYRNWFDLEDCTAYLLKNNYTHPNILVLVSHSAGSITIWNIINRYPHLFKAVMMSYPFLDMLSLLLDSTKPLAQSDYSEFGNPNKNVQSYNIIQAMSPYQNIEHNIKYPFIYLTAGTKDYRCPMQQIAKFTKRYREIRNFQGEHDQADIDQGVEEQQRRREQGQSERFRNIGKKGLLVKVNDASHAGLADLSEQVKDGCQMLACMDYLIQQASRDVFINK